MNASASRPAHADLATAEQLRAELAAAQSIIAGLRRLLAARLGEWGAVEGWMDAYERMKDRRMAA